MAITGQEAQFINSEIQQESGGNYSAVSNAGALGKYQIMPANLPSWEQEAGARQEDANEFLSDHAEQDQVGVYKLDQYYQKYGAAGAASAWYSGSPTPRGSDVQKYVDSVIGRMPSMPTTLSGAANGTSPGTGSGNTGDQSTVTPSSVSSALDPLSWAASALGISSVKEMLTRGALVVFGALILLVGVWRFTGVGSSVEKAVKKAKVI